MIPLAEAVRWLDATLESRKFDDVSNNGLQVARRGEDVRLAAFGVDASVAFLDGCAAAGAQLAVVHHGISWGGGIERIDGSVYAVVKRAIDANIAIYASHLPLDAHPLYGNNAQIAAFLALERVEKAFSYHGNVIGLTGFASKSGTWRIGGTEVSLEAGEKVGVCSGGAAALAQDAKRLGCAQLVTGEADWAETVAARNIGMPIVCAGHYETETFGVRALAGAMAAALDVETRFVRV